MKQAPELVRYGRKDAAPATPPAGTQTPPATPPAGEKTAVEMDEKKILDLIESTVTQSVKDQLAEGLKDQVTADGMKKIIAEALAAMKQDGKALDAAGIKELVQSSAKLAFDSIRREKKSVTDPDDGGSRIEIPYGWCLGNLPTHGKQLFNIIARGINRYREDGGKKRIKVLEITDQELAMAEAKGEAMIAKYQRQAAHIGKSHGFREAYKAWVSTTGGSGDELVPQDLASELQRRFYLATPFGAMFAAREINMPTNPFVLPLVTTLPKFYLAAVESTATTESSPGTSNVTLTAKKFMGETDVSYETTEDAIVAVLPLLQGLLSEGAAGSFEDCLINGDTAGTQDIKDVADVTIAGVAAHHYRAFDGFRKRALAVASLAVDFSVSDDVDETNLRSLKKALGRWGLQVNDLVWVVGASGMNKFEGLTNVRTQDKFGPGATINTGVIERFMGIPILTSAYCREDLNESGVHDDVTETQGSVLLVNVNGFITGSKREFMIETDRDIQKQQIQIVASFRKALSPLETLSASITPLGLGYGWLA